MKHLVHLRYRLSHILLLFYGDKTVNNDDNIYAEKLCTSDNVIKSENLVNCSRPRENFE